MRAIVAENHTIDGHRYVIEPDRTPISREEAADRVARMAKPLRCRGTAPNGMMTVGCRTIADPAELAGRAQFVESTIEGGAYFRNLHEEGGDRYPALRIFCAGWRESLVVSAAEVDLYHRDHEVRPMGSNSSPPSFYLPTNPDVARAAVAAKAVYVMKCHFHESDWTPEKEGRVIDVRDGATWNFPQVFALIPELAATCEECGLRPATWRATVTRATPWRERLLCAHCTATALAPRAVADGEQYIAAVAGLSEKGRRSAARDLAAQVERMERWWTYLPMPPEVAEVLARCRAR